MSTFILTVTCPPAEASSAPLRAFYLPMAANIVDSSQFDAVGLERFFMRITAISELGKDIETLKACFAETAAAFEMEYQFIDAHRPMKCSSWSPASAIASTTCSIAGASGPCRSISSALSQTISIIRRSS